MPDRRTFLRAGLATAIGGCAAAVGGCAGTLGGALGLGGSVKVAVTWSGTELAAFRTVLDAMDIGGYRVELIPLGDDIPTAFGPRTSRRPDVVLLPQPGLVATYRDDLDSLRDSAAAQPRTYSPVWDSLLRYGDDGPGGHGRLYGLPFKASHKSAVWYRRSVLAEHGLDPPRTWREWLALNEVLAGDGIAPLALGAADGWMLTDFFENVLLGCDSAAYDRLARAAEPRLSAEPAVGTALRLLGRMWAADGALAGGADDSLTRQFSDAVVQVFGHRRAAMVVVPDFAESVVRRFTDAAERDDVGVFTFPVVDGDAADPVPSGRRPLIMGGDVAVLPHPASDLAHDLVFRLANRQAPLPWITGYGGFISADQRTPEDGYSAELRTLAADLAGRDDRAGIRFDLSDRLGPIGIGMGRVLQDFLAAVGGRGAGADVPRAADRAVRELAALEG